MTDVLLCQCGCALQVVCPTHGTDFEPAQRASAIVSPATVPATERRTSDRRSGGERRAPSCVVCSIALPVKKGRPRLYCDAHAPATHKARRARYQERHT